VAILGRSFHDGKNLQKTENMAAFLKLSAESMKLEKTGVFAETWPPEREKRDPQDVLPSEN
jgi:hypothetical protein